MPRQPPPPPAPIPYGYQIERSYQTQPGCLTGCAVAILRLHRLVWRLAWRYRWQLTPVGVAVAALLVASITHTILLDRPVRHAYTAVGALAAVTLLAAGGLWWQGQRVGLDRPIERAYAATVTVATGTWTAVATWSGAWNGPMVPTWAVGTLTLAAPWWWHRRIRRRRQDPVLRATADWDQLAPQLGLEGVQIVGQRVSGDGRRWTVCFLLPRTMTPHDFRQKVREGKLDVAFDLRQRACRVEEIPGRARRVDVHITPDDPHAATVEPPPLPRVVSVLDPVPLATDEHGHQVAVRTHDRHGLLGASTGGGKSSVIHNLMRVWGRAVDGLVWGIDMGGGSTLGAWRSRLGRLATDAAAGVAVLELAVRVMEARLGQLGDLDAWPVSPSRPALKVVIDEYDELVEQASEAAELVDTIVRRGRKVAVTVLLTSLRPTKKALGGTALRQQLALRIQLPVIEAQDADLILGYGMRAGGWDPRLLDEPGKMLVFAPPEHSRPKPYKGHWVSKADAIALDRQYARLPLPQLEAAAVGTPVDPASATTDGTRARPADGTAHSPRVGPATVPLAGPPPAPADGPPATPLPGTVITAERDPLRRLLLALEAAGERGAKVPELAEATGMRKTWIYARLQELLASGEVTRGAPGRWRLAAPREPGT
jgi:S-DNA-T family DNA segregation ATPase FtsK/SpoIIIE